MAQGGSIVWNLDIDDTKFKQGLDGASLQAEATAKKINNIDFKGISENAGRSFGNIADIIKRTVLVVGALGVALGGTFIKSAADLEQTSRSFEVLTGNAEVARKLFAKIADFAAKTPFEFPELAKSAQTLLGFGRNANQAFGDLQVLGDIAAATGADMKSLAVVFGQVNATGKLMGQDALQLINNNIPITTILAKKLGVSVQDVRDRMEKGKISADLFNEALVGVTKEGGFAFKGTDKLATTLNGRLSTLKDTVLEFGRNLLGVRIDPELGLVIKPGGVFDRFSLLVPKITDALTRLAPKASAVFEGLINNGPLVLDIIKGILTAFVGFKILSVLTPIIGVFFAALTGGATIASAALAALGGPITIIGVAIVALITALVVLNRRFDLLGRISKRLQPFFETISIAFKSLQAAVAELGHEIGIILAPAFDFLSRNMDTIKTIAFIPLIVIAKALILVIQGLTLVFHGLSLALEFIRDKVIQLRNVFIELKEKALNRISEIIDNIKGAFDKLSDGITSALDTIKNSFNSLPTKLQETFDGMKSALKPWKDDFIGTLTSTLTTAKDALITYNLETLARWEGSLTKMIDAIIEWGSNLALKIGQSLLSSLDSFILWTIEVPKRVSEGLTNAIAAVGDWGSNILIAVAIGLDNIIVSVKTWAINFLEAFGQALLNVGESISTFFVELPTNIATFLENVVTTITTFFSTLPERISEFVKGSGAKVANDTVTGITDVMKARETIDKIGLSIIGGLLLVLASLGIFLIDMGIKIVGKLFDAIRFAIGKISDLLPQFIEAGRQIVNGLVTGIGNARDVVVNKIKEIASGALDAIKRFFGIRSPSAVMAEQGKFIVQGLIEGIKDSQSELDRTVQGVAGDVIDGFSNSNANNLAFDVNGIANGSQSLNINNDGQPVQQTVSTAPSNIIEINVGAFAGTPQELRTFAEKIQTEMTRLSTARGV